MKRILVMIAVMLAPVFAEAAPPLVDRIPGDAMVYVGWTGTNSVGPAYSDSHLKSVLDASGIPKVIDEVIPAVLDKIAAEDPQAREVIPKVVAITAPMWRHPTAFYFGGIEQGGGPPLPRLAFICDAGDEARAMVDHLTEVINQLQPPIPLTAKAYGTLVVVAIGEADAVGQMFGKPPADSLAKATNFVASLNQVEGANNAVLVGYLDVQSIVHHVDELVQQSSDAKVVENWPKIRDGLGLAEFHQIIACTGFDQKDWASQLFVGTTGSTTGLAGLFTGGPLSEDLLTVVPKNSDRVMAFQFNLGSTFRALRQGIEQFQPSATDDVESMIARVNTMLGMDIQKDLFDSLGHEWVAYTDNSIAGPGLLGTVVVNKLSNPQHAEVALLQMLDRANSGLQKVIPDKHITIQFKTKSEDGVTVHYLAVPFVSPAWTIAADRLYLGLYPETVLAAVKHGTDKGNSILASEKFQAVMKRVGDHPPAAIEYLDLPATATEGYSEMLAVLRLYTGFADIFGIDTPMRILPPITTVLGNLQPAGGMSWVDKDGFHSKEVVPFPGAEAFAGGAMASTVVLGEVALSTSILMPSLNRAREKANQVKCASNMRQIGMAMLLYANENKGNYPPDLGTLTKTEDISVGVFTCPSGSTTAPEVRSKTGEALMTPDQVSQWVNDNSDYVYLGKGKNNQLPANAVVLYEKEGSHDGDGTNVLFGDGHVEWYNAAMAKKLIDDQQPNKGGGL